MPNWDHDDEGEMFIGGGGPTRPSSGRVVRVDLATIASQERVRDALTAIEAVATSNHDGLLPGERERVRKAFILLAEAFASIDKRGPGPDDEIDLG
jgi:hypothetical protein